MDVYAAWLEDNGLAPLTKAKRRRVAAPGQLSPAQYAQRVAASRRSAAQRKGAARGGEAGADAVSRVLASRRAASIGRNRVLRAGLVAGGAYAGAVGGRAAARRLGGRNEATDAVRRAAEADDKRKRMSKRRRGGPLGAVGRVIAGGGRGRRRKLSAEEVEQRREAAQASARARANAGGRRAPARRPQGELSGRARLALLGGTTVGLAGIAGVGNYAQASGARGLALRAHRQEARRARREASHDEEEAWVNYQQAQSAARRGDRDKAAERMGRGRDKASAHVANRLTAEHHSELAGRLERGKPRGVGGHLRQALTGRARYKDDDAPTAAELKAQQLRPDSPRNRQASGDPSIIDVDVDPGAATRRRERAARGRMLPRPPGTKPGRKPKGYKGPS